MTSENESTNWDDAIFVALGSNLPGEYGSCEALLEAAVRALDAACLIVVRRSRWWRSSAWPDPAEPGYLNGVVQVDTNTPAIDVMAVLHSIESAFGRARSSPNDPRTLDLDLIAYGRTVSSEPALPHPRAHDRLFVMGPLAEIAPDWLHPVAACSARDLAGAATVGRNAMPIS